MCDLTTEKLSSQHYQIIDYLRKSIFHFGLLQEWRLVCLALNTRLASNMFDSGQLFLLPTSLDQYLLTATPPLFTYPQCRFPMG